MANPNSDSAIRLDQEFGRILEESFNEIFIFHATTLKFIQVNRGARENLGYSMKELRQLTPLDLKPEFTLESFETLIRQLRAGQQQRLFFNTIHRRKDGSQYHVEVHLQLATFHDVPAFIAIILDTTERIKAEQEKQERESHLHAILDAAVEAIITIDEQGTCESLNRAAEAMFGYAAKDVIGNNVSMLMPAPDQGEHDKYMANYLRTGENKVIGIGREVIGLRKTGEEFPVFLAVSEVQLAERRIFTGFLQDITSQKEAQRRLVQSERLAALGEAMARLAHESRNSLQRIQIAVETARLHSEGIQPLTDQLDAIERAGDGLDALLDELKNYAAPLHLEKTDASLSGIWRRAWEATAPSREGRKVDLVEDVSSDQKRCRVDRFRLGQVFRNLFENSLAACQDPVQIKISVSETHDATGNLWELRVLDNGPGFDEQEATKIFEPFYTTKTKGTGLGLAIAYRIVEAHGGKISVGTATKGAEVIIELPREESPNTLRS